MNAPGPEWPGRPVPPPPPGPTGAYPFPGPPPYPTGSPYPPPPQFAPPPPPPLPEPGRAARSGMLLVLGVGMLVALGLGVYGRLHEPTFFAVNVAGFSSGIAAKAWLASGAVVLAVVQLLTAMAMYGRLPGVTAPPWAGTLHRWSGRLAVLLTVPVALHCLYALGFQYGEPRVLLHSLLGCLFYGAFVSKMLALTRPGAPRWSLPVLGGVLFTALVGLWLTSSVWFFATTGITF